MPTEKWFQENPKISAYISKDLHRHLEEWMKGNGVKKVSQALIQILEEYFKVVQGSSKETNSTLLRLETLEGK